MAKIDVNALMCGAGAFVAVDALIVIAGVANASDDLAPVAPTFVARISSELPVETWSSWNSPGNGGFLLIFS